MDDLVEAMLRNSQAMAEALAADRARREAADRIQRESWEAALKEKDAEIDRLREEASDAKKKLQADASRKMRWEAAHELLLGANQKLAELRDADMKEKDAEIDRLRAEAADANNKLEADASRKMGWEAACELLLNAAELRDADMEDSRTCAEPPNSKETENCTKLNEETVDHNSEQLRKLNQAYETLSSKTDKEVSALLSENDSLRSQLDRMQQDYAKLLKNKKVEAAQATEAALKLQKSVDELKVLAQKKDDEIARLQAEAVGAKKEHDTDLCALISEKDSVQNQLSIMQQDYTELLKSKKVLNQKKDHEIVILRAEAVGAKRQVQQMHSLVKEKDDVIQRLKGWQHGSVQKLNKDISETHRKSRPGDPAVTVRDKLEKIGLRQIVEKDYISGAKTVENYRQVETTQKCRHSSSMSNDYEMSGSSEDDDEQIGSDEDGEEQSESGEDRDEQSRSNEDGDEQSRSGSGDDDGQSRSDEHDEDEHKQSGTNDETTNYPIQKPRGNPKRKRDACNAETANGKSHSESNGVAKRRWSYEPPPSPLCRQRLVTAHGRHSMISTGNWAQYVSDVTDSLADQPDKLKEFDQFLWELKQGYVVSYLASTMKDVLDGHPKLIRRFNEFLPNHWQIELEKKSDEKGDEQSGSDEDDGEQSGSNKDHDEQGRNDEDCDELGRSDDIDGQSRSDGFDCEQTGSDEETTNNQVQKPLGRAQATLQGPRLSHPPPALDVMQTSQQVHFRWSNSQPCLKDEKPKLSEHKTEQKRSREHKGSPETLCKKTKSVVTDPQGTSDSALKKHGMKKPRGGPRKALKQKLRDQIKCIYS